MRNEIATMMFVALCCAFGSPLWAAQPALATADWSVSSPHSLATSPPSDDAVLALLHSITSGGELFQLGICSSQFADLRHSGNLSLVVSFSDGRNCYLWIVDKTPSGFESYSAEARSGLAGIKDLGGDGKLELIVSTEFTSYLGAMHCIAIWPVIYAWTGNGYTNVSNQYRGYYEKQLASMKEQIAAAGERNASAVSPTPAFPASVRQSPPVVVDSERASGPSAGFGAPAYVPLPEISPSAPASPAFTPWQAYVPDCTEAEAAKIERFLGISKDAGMSDAIKWADSDNPYQREFAADVLQDIGTPEAVEYLKTLTHDSNRAVAGDANISLSAVQRGPISHSINRNEVEPLAGSPPK
ncbi:MAG: hypothetical protein WAM05_15515 [Candidatus Binataceae bacterium]